MSETTSSSTPRTSGRIHFSHLASTATAASGRRPSARSALVGRVHEPLRSALATRTLGRRCSAHTA